jgi:hypothetical protein
MAVTFSNPTKRSLRVSVKRGYGYYPQMASLMMKTMKDHQMLGTLFSDRHVHTHTFIPFQSFVLSCSKENYEKLRGSGTEMIKWFASALDIT